MEFKTKHLPDRIELKQLKIKKGENGAVSQQFYNDEYGIRLTAEKSGLYEEWKETWICEYLPGEVFSNYAELQQRLVIPA